MSEQRAGARDAALDFIEDQHQAVFVAQVTQAFQEFLAGRANAAFALDRLYHDAANGRVDRGLDRIEIVERQHVEPVGQGFKAFAHLFLVGCRNRRQRAAVKGVGKGENAEFFGMAGSILKSSTGLDGAFDRFGTRIGEEYRVGKGQRHEAFRKCCLRRHFVEVRRVHQRRCLLLDGADEVRVAVAEQIDRDTAGKIEPFAPLGIIEVAAVTAHRLDLAAAIDGHQGGNRHCLDSVRCPLRTPERTSVTLEGPNERRRPEATA